MYPSKVAHILTKKLLIDLYWNKKLTDKKIAILCHVSEYQVIAARKKFGIYSIFTPKRYCADCGKEINKYYKSFRCNSCWKKFRKKKINPNRAKEYYLKNKKKLTKAHKIYYQINKKRLNKWHKDYVERNKLRIQKRRKEYYLKNRIKLLKKQKIYAFKNRERKKAYDLKNKKRIQEQTNKRNKIKYNNDLDFKLKRLLRSRLTRLVKGENKFSSVLTLLGCSIFELRQYIEKQFKEGMSWNNYGHGFGNKGMKEWHVDHITPLAKFDLTKKSAQKKAFHYTNLQPLWAKENLEKGIK